MAQDEAPNDQAICQSISMIDYLRNASDRKTILTNHDKYLKVLERTGLSSQKRARASRMTTQFPTTDTIPAIVVIFASGRVGQGKNSYGGLRLRVLHTKRTLYYMVFNTLLLRTQTRSSGLVSPARLFCFSTTTTCPVNEM